MKIVNTNRKRVQEKSPSIRKHLVFVCTPYALILKIAHILKTAHILKLLVACQFAVCLLIFLFLLRGPPPNCLPCNNFVFAVNPPHNKATICSDYNFGPGYLHCIYHIKKYAPLRLIYDLFDQIKNRCV